MEKIDYKQVFKSRRLISEEYGILQHIQTIARQHSDPYLKAFGIWPCDSRQVGGKRYSGRSSGSGYSWPHALMATLGEVVERYCPAFYSQNDLVKGTYKDLGQRAFNPSEVALFHKNQYEGFLFPFIPFTEDVELHWTPCYDLINGGEILYPGSLVYLPWVEDEEWISLTTSTGLAAHTDLYKAILIALYETIERDSFVITWMQELTEVPKIKISKEIQSHLDSLFPLEYEFHFFDITFDLKVPTVFGMCFGETDYGKFVSVGTATRGTYKEAISKTILEIGQTFSYFRYLLGEKTTLNPEKFEDIRNFEDHSIFYLKRQDLMHIFDKWRDIKPTKEIDFYENSRLDSPQKEILEILTTFKENDCDVLVKYLTTPDVRDAGFHSVKVITPQLIELSGSYTEYFSGGRRLYEVPEKMGYK